MTGPFESLRLFRDEACSPAARDRRDRTLRLAAIFFFVQIAIAGLAAAGIEGIDIPRSAGETIVLLAAAILSSIVIGLLFLRGVARSGMGVEDRAAESEARIRDFAEVAADWFCELDRDLRIVCISNRLFEMNNSSTEDLRGRAWLEAGAEIGVPNLPRKHRETLAARMPFHDHRFKHHAPDGRTVWSISGKPLFEDGGGFAGYRIAASDITPLIVTQEALRAARDEAERAGKAKANFLAGMSHELRTPLNAVLGFSEIIEREIIGPLGNPKYAEYARDIHDSAEHLLAIVSDILELSRIEAGHVELREQEFAVWDVIEGVLRLCRRSAGRSGIVLRADVPKALPCVLGDPQRVKQILINLVSNAVKFAPKGGRVIIGCRHERDGSLKLTVRNDGIGMTAEEVRKATQPFERTDGGLNRKFEGTGLGLPLARMLAEHHGGTLCIASAPGKGALVTFTLPAWRVARAEIAVAAG